MAFIVNLLTLIDFLIEQLSGKYAETHTDTF